MELKKIFTFGYAEKEERAKLELERVDEKWQNWEKEAKLYDQSKNELDELINAILSICKNKNLNEDIVFETYNNLLKNNISALIQDVSIGGSVFIGATAGAVGAIGAFTLVGTFGVASTGVAISSLAGAAATSATLAALGGGSIAAGGAGIVGGICALGGIATVVAVPSVMTFNSYSRKQKYEQATIKIREALENAPSIETIKKQKEKLCLLKEKLTEMYRESCNGKITTEELHNYLKRLIDESNAK